MSEAAHHDAVAAKAVGAPVPAHGVIADAQGGDVRH